MLRIGLTGGIASGKTTVARWFVELGAGLVDTDRIARDVVAPGSAALAEIENTFGTGVVAADGSLDRRALRSRIFADEHSRRALEAILHPLIRARALAEADACRGPYVLIAVPLLVETGFAELVDRVLVVDCPEKVQLERLMRRDDLDPEAARAMLGAQTDRATRLEAADDVIDNSGDPNATRAQVERLHARYLALGRNCP